MAEIGGVSITFGFTDTYGLEHVAAGEILIAVACSNERSMLALSAEMNRVDDLAHVALGEEVRFELVGRDVGGLAGGGRMIIAGGTRRSRIPISSVSLTFTPEKIAESQRLTGMK